MNTTKGELVQFKASDGLVLAGFLSRARNPNATVIIHVHGFGGNFASWSRLFQIYGRALKQGFSIFSINTRGAGLKTWFRSDHKSFTIGSSNEVFEDSVKDISGAITAAKRLGYAKVILSGHSTGCQKATYYQSVAQDKSVKGLILLAPADDYNLHKKDLGDRFEPTAALARAMVALGKGGHAMPEWTGVSNMSAARFTSVANKEMAEASLFNYESDKLELYSKIRCPVLAVFGRREQYKTKRVSKYIEKLRNDRNDGYLWFTGKVVSGADHGFTGKAPALSKIIGKWLEGREASPS
ncbi:MAG: alpha/beta hydrolase [Nitrososphaerota archaeon]|nr:alpha/beta hydrolase [Nitrososphaerota archaeon]